MDYFFVNSAETFWENSVIQDKMESVFSFWQYKVDMREGS